MLETLARSSPRRSRPSWCRPTRRAQIQSTEAKIGPYELQDFNLFYVLRYGFRPSKIAFLALHAWGDAAARGLAAGLSRAERRHAYTLAEIKQLAAGVPRPLLRLRQFKRSALPNGPKVAAGGSLSPRGDWRAPSDGNARIWLEELENEIPQA